MEKRMQAVILNAGKARRLYPLSKDKPTCLFDISGRSLLEHHVALLRSFGIGDILVVIGHCAEKVRKIGRGLRFLYNPYFPVTGDIVSLWYAQRKLKGEFLYFHGDGFYSKGVVEGLLKAEGEIVLAIQKGEENTTYERVRIDEGLITEIRFTKDISAGDGSFIGAAKISDAAFSRYTSGLDEMINEGRLEDQCVSVFQRLIEKGNNIHYFQCEEATWLHIDTPDDLERVRELWGQATMGSE